MNPPFYYNRGFLRIIIRLGAYATFWVFFAQLASGVTIPAINADGLQRVIQLPKELINQFKSEHIKFVTPQEMTVGISSTQGGIFAILGHHSPYDARDANIVSELLQNLLQSLPKDTLDDTSFVGVGPLGGIEAYFRIGFERLQIPSLRLPKFFLFMQRSELDELVRNSAALAVHRIPMRLVICVIPDFDPDAQSAQIPETIIANSLTEARSNNAGRPFHVTAFGGGLFEEAILARLMTETAYFAIDRGDARLMRGHFQIWLEMLTKHPGGANLTSLSALRSFLPNAREVPTEFLHPRIPGFLVNLDRAKPSPQVSPIVSSRALSVIQQRGQEVARKMAGGKHYKALWRAGLQDEKGLQKFAKEHDILDTIAWSIGTNFGNLSRYHDEYTRLESAFSAALCGTGFSKD